MASIVALSDTHGMHHMVTVPDADIMVFAGDFTGYQNLQDFYSFCEWVAGLPHRHKIVIAGNHDLIADTAPDFVAGQLSEAGAIYLMDQWTTVEGIKFYGSPWTPAFLNWYFMANRGEDIAGKWDKIPDDTDVLITHGPPYGVLDKVRGKMLGCEDLLNRINKLNLRAHIFGHIHNGYGMVGGRHLSINASICTEEYSPIKEPIKIKL